MPVKAQAGIELSFQNTFIYQCETSLSEVLTSRG